MVPQLPGGTKSFSGTSSSHEGNMYIATETRALQKSIEEVKPADNGDQKHGALGKLAFLRRR